MRFNDRPVFLRWSTVFIEVVGAISRRQRRPAANALVLLIRCHGRGWERDQAYPTIVLALQSCTLASVPSQLTEPSHCRGVRRKPRSRVPPAHHDDYAVVGRERGWSCDGTADSIRSVASARPGPQTQSPAGHDPCSLRSGVGDGSPHRVVQDLQPAVTSATSRCRTRAAQAAVAFSAEHHAGIVDRRVLQDTGGYGTSSPASRFRFPEGSKGRLMRGGQDKEGKKGGAGKTREGKEGRGWKERRRKERRGGRTTYQTL
eukprot:123258-Hanusia_phi.AAC.2